MLQDAATAADRVRALVRDLRIFSRHQEKQNGPVALHPLLESSVRMAWNEIRHRARLVTELGDVPLVEASEPRLGQVFLNLIVNAAQAMPEGHTEENVLRIATRTDAQGRAVVEVTDTGSGMSPETLRSLFRPFFTTKPVGVGTGLGLAICRRIITDLHGEISVESELGKGTTFRVTLPAAQQSRLPAPAATPARLRAARKARILAIDDEAMIVGLIRESLKSEHEVVTATLASEALARIDRGEQFDLVLCDVMMPETSGMQLYAELLKRDPSFAQRTMFMTGGAFSDAALQFLESIDNPLIEKPFDAEALSNAINEFMNRSGEPQGPGDVTCSARA
jgi:CheY-like chemotaxis protein